jgi:hypothetical protein
MGIHAIHDARRCEVLIDTYFKKKASPLAVLFCYKSFKPLAIEYEKIRSKTWTQCFIMPRNTRHFGPLDSHRSASLTDDQHNARKKLDILAIRYNWN